MTKPNVLISSLGDSPAVVTEAIDKVEHDEQISFDTVITIRTSHYDSLVAEEDVLAGHIVDYYKGRILYVPLSIGAKDIDSQEDNLEYLTVVAEQLKQHQASDDVYVSLAGGRKTMSALMAIAVQIYGATLLFHVVHQDLDRDLELQRKMKPNYLRDLGSDSDELNLLMHPPLQKIQLARFPIVSLFPLLNDLHSALAEHAAPPSDPRLQQILESSKLIRAEFGSWTRTKAGEQLFAVLEDAANTPDIARIREQIVADPGAGGQVLRGFLEQHARWHSKRAEVDSVRGRIAEIERELELHGPDQHLHHEKSRLRLFLIKTCTQIEDEERPTRQGHSRSDLSM
jgi:CRISPR-associated Csx14 family protein